MPWPQLIPGVLGAAAGAADDSFYSSLLEYPQYTKPAVFRGMAVPEVLRNGDHAKIDAWRREASLARTLELRPDLLQHCDLSPADQKILAKLKGRKRMTSPLYVGLVHYPYMIRTLTSLPRLLPTTICTTFRGQPRVWRQEIFHHPPYSGAARYGA